ncbi:hypothetical protein LSH36_44g04003 [Paralvinella palmiformis]|uniref:GH10 domain-containing protein n=1 Tax=Paralvinella palmiformis TaxID=53620 RepID=A0AAD9ND47_9ANNE|nr:hypothetical protein LSH36_44g04003 [Paralvinella palmiformis]
MPNPIALFVTDTSRYQNIGTLPALRAASHWRQLGSDFKTGLAVKSLKFEFQVEPVDLEFLLDSVSLIELPFDRNWKRQTDIDIDKYRKNMLTLSMYVPKKLNAFCKVMVKLRQKKRHFGFGSAMKADIFNGENTFGAKYRHFFFNNFEWAVFENDMKWKPMERWKGSPKLSRVDTSLDHLEAKNVTTRGHAVLWSVKDTNPNWAQSLTGDDLVDAVNTRIDYVVKHFKGRLIQWDGINEYLHGNFYSKMTNDPLFIDKVHKRIHSIDPDVDIVVNDYQTLRDSELMSALVDLADTLRKRNVPVHGIGLQSHMIYVPTSPEAIKKRLEIATSIGLPVTLTEVSIHSTNVSLRAWQLEVLLRMAFSNPGVRGFVLWEFSDLDEIDYEAAETALFTGADYTPNEAGAVLQKLLKRWKTGRNLVPKARYMRKRLSAYHGLYEAKIYYKDKFIKNVTFYLHPGQDLKFRIRLSADEVKDVADDDPDACGVWDNGKDDSDQKSNPRNKGRAYMRLRSNKKKAKVQAKPEVKGRNIDQK